MNILFHIFLKASIKDHLDHVGFCLFIFLKMHTECIMNNDHKSPTEAIQHRHFYYARVCIMQIMNQTNHGSQMTKSWAIKCMSTMA